MKKGLIICLLLILIWPAEGQKLEKYEDVLPSILALPYSGALAQLKIYLAEEPTNPSIFLQMAVIYEKRYKEGDPIKDYAYKLGNAEEALKAYTRTEQLITEKDVRRNDENYFNFGQIDDRGRIDVSYDTIQSKITSAKAELSEFIDHAPRIYEKFTQSFSQYDQAHKEFTAILGEFPTFKDLYLLYDERVDSRFKKVKEAYQKSLGFWEEYKTETAAYDIGYNQELSIYPVKVYRLDGLESKINFLADKIHMWDYAKWVDTTRAVIHEEIDRLRVDLAAENLRIDQQISSVQPDYIRGTLEPLHVDKEVLFNLRKYDLNSVIEPLFIYKEEKHDLLHQKMIEQDLDTASEVTIDRKLYFYGQMINKIQVADTTLNAIINRNTQASLDKYQDFITNNYNGMAGITQFVSTERSNNEADSETYTNKIRDGLYSLLEEDTIQQTVAHQKLNIPYDVVLPVDNEQLTPDPITTHKVVNFDGSLYLGGIMRNEEESKSQAFITGVTADSTIGWHNEYLLQIDSTVGFDADTRIGAMEAIPGGIAVILNGVDSAGTRINHLFLLDEKGETTLSRRLLLDQFPRQITYSERNNTLLVSYKGEDYLDDILLESELIVARYNILGDLQWQQRMSYKGDFLDAINIGDGYLILGNANEIKGMDGRIARAGTGNMATQLFAWKLDLSGTPIAFSSFSFTGPYYTNKVYKVSDDCINVLGKKGNYEQQLELITDPVSAIYIIFDQDLEVLADSF